MTAMKCICSSLTKTKMNTSSHFLQMGKGNRALTEVYGTKVTGVWLAQKSAKYLEQIYEMLSTKAKSWSERRGRPYTQFKVQYESLLEFWLLSGTERLHLFEPCWQGGAVCSSRYPDTLEEEVKYRVWKVRIVLVIKCWASSLRFWKCFKYQGLKTFWQIAFTQIIITKRPFSFYLEAATQNQNELLLRWLHNPQHPYRPLCMRLWFPRTMPPVFSASIPNIKLSTSQPSATGSSQVFAPLCDVISRP